MLKNKSALPLTSATTTRTRVQIEHCLSIVFAVIGAVWIKEKVVLHFPLSFACLCIVFVLSLHCLSIGFAVIVEEGSKFLALS